MNAIDNAKDLLACALGETGQCTLIASPDSGFFVALSLAIIIMLAIAVGITMLNLLIVDFFIIRIRAFKALPWLIAIPSLIVQLVLWLEFAVPFFATEKNYFMWMFLTPVFTILPAVSLVILFTLLCHFTSGLISLVRGIISVDDSTEPAIKFRRLYHSPFVTVPVLALLVWWHFIVANHPVLRRDPLSWPQAWLDYGVNLWPVELAINAVWSMTLALSSWLGVGLYAGFALVAGGLSLWGHLRARAGRTEITGPAAHGANVFTALVSFTASLYLGYVVMFAFSVGVIASLTLFFGWIAGIIAFAVLFFVALITMLRRSELAPV